VTLYFLTIFIGALASVMVALNGFLAERYGLLTSTVIIHISGLLIISVVLAVKRDRAFMARQKWFLYTGGAVGVLTIIFNNLAFSRISVSAITALVLFGQAVSGLVIDHWGWLGIGKKAFYRHKLIGLVLVMAGIAAMINSFEVIAVLVSFIAGINIAVTRMTNGRLAALTSWRASAWYNFMTGSVFAIIVFLLFGRGEAGFAELSLDPRLYIYLGGAMGVFMISLVNIIVMRVSALYFALLLFIGQVAAGLLIDMLLSGEFSWRNVVGGVLVALGLCVNLWMDQKRRGLSG